MSERKMDQSGASGPTEGVRGPLADHRSQSETALSGKWPRPRYQDEVSFDTLKGRTLVAVGEVDGELRFVDSTGTRFLMYHDQDCCEHVDIEDINGALGDLIGNPLLIAEEATSDQNPKREEYAPGKFYEPDSFTWTFYKLATVKGYVDIRWYGESNGYYSESVSFAQVPQ